MADKNNLFDDMDMMIDLTHINKSFINVTSRHWKPPTDIYETRDNYTIFVDLAGMKKSEISLKSDSGYLIISGSRKRFYCPNTTSLHRMEIDTGVFMRKIRLNIDVLEKDIEAEYLDGILIITIPKRSKE